jgi:RNA polymerase sigma factor FliA
MAPSNATKGDEADEALLWRAWRTDRDLGARERLVHRYLWLAKTIALTVFRDRGHAGDIDPRELVQLATVGLLEAIDRYEPGRGANFGTFAKKRVHGAIIDGLDQSSEVRAQSAALRVLRRERMKSIATGAQSNDRFKKLVDVAVGLAIGLMLEDTAMFVDESRRGESPYSSAETAVLREQLKQIVEGLSSQEYKIVRYHYYHELSFSQIGELMDLSKARISQIHGKALTSIRQTLGETASFDQFV